MSYNMIVFLIALAIIFILSIVWYIMYTGHLKNNCYTNGTVEGSRLFDAMQGNGGMSNVVSECPIGLPNTDDDVADALEYVEPSKLAGGLLERLYEQGRV